ncbi:hypothetical protein NQ318_003606 [Aromia moschata]|uniref:Uncharacterized protein n=1 Tax=Aromia moschata TaxID=1265417 RepID=A0AAV8YWV6_9CUCU|nr:hypothetical protein NQ318_003606 [Aromia moschata]
MAKFCDTSKSEGQCLGIVQKNNTAVIETTCDGVSLTNWVPTEINESSVESFLQEKNQVRDRLNSIGRDISILVQPLDLIKQLKKAAKVLKEL